MTISARWLIFSYPTLMQPVRALQSTGKSKACFTWHYAFVKNSLHFSEKIAYKVYDEFQEKYIKKLDDGTLEVSFRYQLNEWTFLYLLSFGEYVEIIEPAQAREILKEKVKKILSLYQ